MSYGFLEVEAIIDRHKQDWLAVDGVLGVGSAYQGELGSFGARGETWIVVYAEKTVPDGSIPLSIEGVKVVVEAPEDRSR